MNDWKAFFAGKRITQMGLGLLGRGVGDAAFLAERAAELTVTDLRDEKTLAPSLARLAKYQKIRYVLGEHDVADFTSVDFILKAAGVPLDSPYIAEAINNGVPVYMSTALFAKFASDMGVTLVGVTGTRGKSTVTHMIHHALVAAGRRAHLGGNIRGLSTLGLLPEIQTGDIVVLELDSWQLQGFGTQKISPDIAVFTNLKIDHLNYYPNEETYFADKANIYRFQKAGDTLIAGNHLVNQWLGSEIPPGRVVAPHPLPADWKLKLLGGHNKENAAFAFAALHTLGLDDTEIKTGLESFEPIEGRLQFVREVNGVKIYNDNNATTPDATIAALAALSNDHKGVVLIAGGADKDIDSHPLAGLVNEASFVKGLVLLPGSGTEKFKAMLTRDYVEIGSMQEALQLAMGTAKTGESILFSPGFASFGLFRNEYDRNDQFLRIVGDL